MKLIITGTGSIGHIFRTLRSTSLTPWSSSPAVVNHLSPTNHQLRKESLCRLFSNQVSVAVPPQPDVPIAVSSPVNQDKQYDPKITKLVDDIGRLTLLEVSDLNDLLKRTLNIPDTPMMMSGAMVQAVQGQPVEEQEEAAPTKVQTSFTVKLTKFDDTKKVALIKEVKSLLEGMNLVQAKKFVESAPTTVKADISKEEAEKLAAALTSAGATCEIV